MASEVSMQSGAHGKLYMCTLVNKSNIKYTQNFYEG